jgi:hypothetical protein
MFRDEWSFIDMQTPRSLATLGVGSAWVLINTFPGLAVLINPIPEPALHPHNKIVIADKIKKTVFFIF